MLQCAWPRSRLLPVCLFASASFAKLSLTACLPAFRAILHFARLLCCIICLLDRARQRSSWSHRTSQFALAIGRDLNLQFATSHQPSITPDQAPLAARTEAAFTTSLQTPPHRLLCCRFPRPPLRRFLPFSLYFRQQSPVHRYSHCRQSSAPGQRMQKKTSLTELFYLALLVSALRPPDNYLLYRRERYWNGPADTLGSTLAENICFNSANRFLNSNGAFCSDHYSAKSSVLLDQTHEALEYINSLGRYSQPTPFSSNFFAYPVSRGLSEVSQPSPESTSVTDDADVPASTLFSTNEPDPFTDDISFGGLNVRHTFVESLKMFNNFFKSAVGLQL